VISGGAWLSKLGWAHLGIANTTTLEGLTSVGVAEVIRSAGPPLESLAYRPEVVAELRRLSNGDPLLVRLYLEDLRQDTEHVAGRLQLQDLAGLSPGLRVYFARWWREQREIWRRRALGGEEPMQESRVRHVFSFLACSVGPLMLEDLIQLISPTDPVSRRDIRDCIEPLARFVVGDGSELGFTFSHPLMASYFREEELTPDECERCELRLIEWCEGLFQKVKLGSLNATQLPLSST
jgi:hypothetical protein